MCGLTFDDVSRGFAGRKGGLATGTRVLLNGPLAPCSAWYVAYDVLHSIRNEHKCATYNKDVALVQHSLNGSMTAAYLVLQYAQVPRKSALPSAQARRAHCIHAGFFFIMFALDSLFEM